MKLAIHIAALILRAVSKDLVAFSILLSITERSREIVAVFGLFNTLTVLDIVHPVAFVVRAVDAHKFAFSLRFIVFEFTFIVFLVWIHKASVALSDVIDPVSIILLPVAPSHLAVAMSLFVCIELTLVNGFVIGTDDNFFIKCSAHRLHLLGHSLERAARLSHFINREVGAAQL